MMTAGAENEIGMQSHDLLPEEFLVYKNAKVWREEEFVLQVKLCKQ
jgi:hypothetical protein